MQLSVAAWRWARRLLCGDTALAKRLIETLNIKVTPAKVDLLFDEADDNKDGTIDRKELPAFVVAAITFERDKESDSLHHAQQVVLGENQLIDRFGRASSRSLIEIFAEQAQLQCIITQRDSDSQVKSMAFAFSVGYILLKCMHWTFSKRTSGRARTAKQNARRVPRYTLTYNVIHSFTRSQPFSPGQGSTPYFSCCCSFHHCTC